MTTQGSMPRSMPRCRPALAFAGAAGWSLAAAWVAYLTVVLNPHLTDGARLRLLTLFVAVAATAGALAGLAAALLPALAGRLGVGPAARRRLAAALAGVLALAPPLYALLLPDSGVAGHLLTDALFAPGTVRRVLVATAVAVALAAAGVAGGLALRRAPRWLPLAAWGLLVAGVAGLALAVPGGARLTDAATGDPSPAPAATSAPVTSAPATPASSAPSDETPRVVLLLVDGADLQVIAPLVAAGELPTFARLMQEGTWGPLATLEPTLSPVVWTTIATGKPPAEHGILHFTWFRLPGVGQPILAFPLHTGLNFRLFPLLEELPGQPALRVPYASSMRRAPALWNLVGRSRPVGVFQWLVTWPAEPVPGFVVAGGFGAVQHGQVGRARDPRAFWPRRLARDLPTIGRRRPSDAELRRYTGPGVALDRRDRDVDLVARSAGDESGETLAELVARYRPAFVAAGFYPVDAYHHRFAAAYGTDRPFAPAIAERYRLTDRRLGELIARLEALPGDTHLLVVSDHGFDFAHHHHTWAPPGVFFARGPAFSAGRRVDDLSVYDVAPLVLHLLGMPVPLDMPSAADGAYRSAVSGPWLRAHPVPRIPTYGAGDDDGLLAGEESPLDEDIREQLKSLGYIR